jgi:hypothetical protein
LAATSNQSSTARVAAIVGSIVGALGLIGVIAAIIVLRRRRRSIENIGVGASATSRGVLSLEPGSVPIIPNSAGFIGNDRIITGRTNSSSYLPFSPVPAEPASYPREDVPPGYIVTPQEGHMAGYSNFLPVSSIRESVMRDDELGRWAVENRSSVPYELEQSLRAARYLPSDNPDVISPDVWRDTYGVGHFELKRLQEIYAR